MDATAEPVNARTALVHVVASELNLRYAALRLASPKAVAALSRSIQRHGVLHPLTANREGDALVLLDGFKRLQVLELAPDVTFAVRVVELTPEQGKAALLSFNRPHRGLCELEEAWVVAALVSEHGLRQTEVAELVGRHKSWVCRRLQLARGLDESVVNDVQLGLISPTVARELARLPRGNAQGRVAAVIGKHELTSRQAAELVTRVLAAPAQDSAAALLDDPLSVLCAVKRGSRRRGDARLSEAGQRVFKALDTVWQQAERGEHRLLAAPFEVLTDTDDSLLQPSVGQVVEALQRLVATVGRLTQGSTDA